MRDVDNATSRRLRLPSGVERRGRDARRTVELVLRRGHSTRPYHHGDQPPPDHFGRRIQPAGAQRRVQATCWPSMSTLLEPLSDRFERSASTRANVKSRILVIDDEVGIRDSMRRTLEYQGYQFVGAATGQEGLALIERDPPDLVFLDIKMPGMDGLEVLERIKASNPAVPVVMVSGHGTAQNAFEARDKGASGFIEKPFSEPVLLERIEKELGRHSHRDRLSRAAAGSRFEVSDGRQQPGAAKGRRSDPEGGARACDRAAAGRKRCRQGACCANDSSAEPAQPRAVRAGELRGDSRRPHRIGAVRPREGILHRRDRTAGGKVRAGRPRDHLPRRSRRHEPEDAGQSAARASGRGSRAARLGENGERRRAGDCRDEQASRNGNREGKLPRGSVFPPRRHPDLRAAAARARRKTFRC